MWPIKDDISWQEPDDIIMILSLPTILPGRALEMQFDMEELARCKEKL
jgi:hypothetical protein